MRTDRHIIVSYSPLVLGCLGILVAAVYQCQRSGLLPHSLSRLVQSHLDGVGITAFVLAVTGMVTGLVLSKVVGERSIIKVGTSVSVVGSLSTLFMSL